MVRQAKIDNLYIFDTLPLSNIWCSAFVYFISSLLFKNDHDIFWLKISVDDVKLMEEYYCFHDVSDNESTLELIKELSFTNVLEKIFSVNVLCYNVFMAFCVQGVDVLYNLIMIDNLHYFRLVTNGLPGLIVQLRQVNNL